MTKRTSNLRAACGFTLSLFTASGLAACGGGDGDNGVTADANPLDPDAGAGCATPAAQRLLPLAVGATWTFTVTDGAATETKTSTVQAYEDVGATKAGIMAFRVRTEKIDGSTVSWQEDQCDKIVRHREQSFDLGNVMVSEQIYNPQKLRVDETPDHVTLGATWIDTYTEVEEDQITGDIITTDKSESWTVDAASESITVPAGTFDAIKLHRVGTDVGASDKYYWFAPGVGKIKETGTQTEELSAYDLP